MKQRLGFVTNSSSSSFLVCFARIKDETKADLILHDTDGNYNCYGELNILTAEEVLEEMSDTRYGKWLEYNWAWIDATPDESYVKNNMDSNFIVYKESHTLFEDEDGYCNYDCEYGDFDTNFLDKITEENGFADVDIQFGAGRDG